MRLPPRRVRRLALPVLVAALVGPLAVFVAASALCVLLTPVSRRPLRATAFGAGYLFLELVGLVLAGLVWLRRPRIGRWGVGSASEWDAANQRLLGRALAVVLRWSRCCFGYRVEVSGAADPPELLDGTPVLVLARHAGPGDSFSVVHLLLGRYGRSVRIVLKDLLQLDPLLDVLLNRVGCCFVSARGADRAARVAALAGRLTGRDALLVFPEGGNWTPGRWHRAVQHLWRTGKRDAARAGELMTHVLPPRPAGVLAALDARPGLPVVLVAHAGLDRIVSAAEAWRAVPLTQPMTVRAWPTAPPPEDEADRIAWLTAEWATVDEWVDAHWARRAPA